MGCVNSFDPPRLLQPPGPRNREESVREAGTVSLWVGVADSGTALEAALEFKYTEVGDCIPPPFARAFSIQWFDEDFREALYLANPPATLSGLLRGVSYHE